MIKYLPGIGVLLLLVVLILALTGHLSFSVGVH